jgi:hypothetical protein
MDIIPESDIDFGKEENWGCFGQILVVLGNVWLKWSVVLF